jgi:phage tail-like protein
MTMKFLAGGLSLLACSIACTAGALSAPFTPATPSTTSTEFEDVTFAVYFGAATKAVPGIIRISGLGRSFVTESSRGHAIPTQVRTQSITFVRTISGDLTFENWADRQAGLGNNGNGSPVPALMDIRIRLMDTLGRVSAAFNLYNCTVTEFTALPALDNEHGNRPLEKLTVSCASFVRDTNVVPPSP